jgi:predicted negative regulator of RcsB-dependent stress response
MPVDVVLDLEGAADDPVVTRCLAAQQGFVLFRLPAVRACRLWDRHHRRIVREGSVVFTKLTEMLEDGRISKQEAADLRVEVDAALAAFAGLRSSLEKRIERTEPGKRMAE